MLDELLSLPLERQIGQLFFVGISGTSLDAETRELLDEIKPGGVCLFARNIRERGAVRELLDGLAANIPTSPLLSLDQEGGLVDRLRRIIEPMPAANQVRTVEAAAELGALTAEVLRLLGFNMNFAPVVDVIDADRSRPDNGLYSRAFGSTKEEVTELAGAYLRAMLAGGVVGCVKHFPGLGAATIDSHESLPEVDLDRQTLNDVDLYPYVKLLDSCAYAVMTAHAAFPKHNLQEVDADGKLLPSSLSYNFTTKILRDRFAFQGLALTDDLEMGAIVKNYGIGDACLRAIRAGQDQLLICNNADAIREGYRAVLGAARKGEITTPRLDISLHRISVVKKKIKPPLVFDDARLSELSAAIADLKARLK